MIKRKPKKPKKRRRTPRFHKTPQSRSFVSEAAELNATDPMAVAESSLEIEQSIGFELHNLRAGFAPVEPQERRA